MNPQELTPGELAQRAGVAVSALHFYEREGLITSRRTAGNQRRYTRDTLRRVAFIRMSQRLGIPLARVRDALATLPTDRVPVSKDWARLSAGWRRNNWSIDVFVKNVTDERAEMTRFAQCAALTCGYQPYTVIAQPRTFGIRFSQEF